MVKAIDGLTLGNVEGKKDVYIVVSKKKPHGCVNFTVGQDSKVVFEAKVALAVMVDMGDRHEDRASWKFEAVHCSRWGDGFRTL